MPVEQVRDLADTGQERAVARHLVEGEQGLEEVHVGILPPGQVGRADRLAETAMVRTHAIVEKAQRAVGHVAETASPVARQVQAQARTRKAWS